MALATTISTAELSQLSIDLKLLQQERLRRRTARASLVAFANSIDIPGRPYSEDDEEYRFNAVERPLAAHHRLMMDALQTTMLTPHGRLMLFLPPGSAKSTYGAVVAPTWYMGVHPGSKVLLGSYGTELAKRHGRRARQVARSPEYRSLLQTSLSPDTSAADEWALTNGSEYIAGGILAGVTGNRAHGIIIDDPVKGREDADSENMRRRTRASFEDDWLSRLVPGGWIVLIQTRWHEDDLAGSLLPEHYDGESGDILCRDGQNWHVLCLPAECERVDDPLGRAPGEMLWPEWFTDQHWSQFRHNPRTWAALFQQRPAPEEGDYFKREWIGWYDRVPAHLHKYGASDYATTHDSGDFTVHGVFGLAPDDRIYVLDWWRQQAQSDIWVETLIDLMECHKPLAWAEEKGQIAKSIGPFLNKRMRARRVNCLRRDYASIRDKPVRARAIQARMAMPDGPWLLLPRGAPWAEAFIHELMMFPNGVNDDQVDVLSLLGRMLDRLVPGRVPPKPKELEIRPPTLDELIKMQPKLNDGLGERI